MKAEKEPTFLEWVRARQVTVNEIRVRAQAYCDASKTQEEKNSWTWLIDAFGELTNAFHALEWVENYRAEGDYKIYQDLTEQQKIIAQLIKKLLGLDDTASPKDITKRANEFGKLVDDLLDKKKTLDKATQQKK
jgi:hypothetical protein